MKTKPLNSILVGIVTTLIIAGCGGPKIDPGPDVAMLEQSTERIIVAFKSGNPEAAHGSLHEVGFLLNQIEQKAEALSIPQGTLEQLTLNTESLRKEFAGLDGFLHGEELPEDYDISPVAEKLRKAVVELQQLFDSGH